MRALGISAYYHDAAAALVVDGRIIAAAQEERFTRKKHDACFPRNAVAYCLREGRSRLNDLDRIAESELVDARMSSWQLAGRPDAHAGFCSDGEMTCQSMGMLLQEALHYPHASGWAFVMKAKQHHTLMRLAAAKNEVTKILIVRHEDSSFARGADQDIRIVGLRHCFGHGEDIVTDAAQVCNNCSTAGLVHDKVHGGCQLGWKSERKNRFVGQHLGGIGQGCVDVIGLQARVLLQDVTLRDALSQHPHNEFDRDAGSPNDRLTGHDLGV